MRGRGKVQNSTQEAGRCARGAVSYDDETMAAPGPGLAPEPRGGRMNGPSSSPGPASTPSAETLCGPRTLTQPCDLLWPID